MPRILGQGLYTEVRTALADYEAGNSGTCFDYDDNGGLVNDVTIILTHFSAKSVYKFYVVCNKISVQR